MVVGFLLVVHLAQVGQPAACRESERTALLRAQEQVSRGDERAAATALELEGESCALRRIASLALRGWREARALAPGGGAVDLQGPVRGTLDALAALSADSTWSLEIEYAQTSIRAAIAAAQDERPEMELLLTHTRDLSERLLQRDRRAVWPRPFNVVAGELWFEVDRYADSVAAYERAIRADASPLALIGLARSLARLERLDEACAAYRRVSSAAAPLRELAAKELAHCQ